MTTKRTVVINLFKTLIIGALVLVGTIAPFIHINYNDTGNVYSQEYQLHKAKYKPIIKKRDLALKTLISDLENRNITIDNYTNSYKNILKSSNLELKEYTNIKNKLLASYKFFGFNSKRLFFQNIGIPILALIISLFFLNIIFNPITEKLKKSLFVVIGCLFIFISVYVILWTLLAQRVFQGDFPESWYNNILTYTPFVITLISLLLFYNYTLIEAKLKSIINQLIIFIIKSDKYIENKSTKTQHLKDYLTEFEKIVK